MFRRSTTSVKAKLTTGFKQTQPTIAVRTLSTTRPQTLTSFKPTQPTISVRSQHKKSTGKLTRAQWDTAINQLQAEVSHVIPYGPGFFVLTDAKYSSAKTATYERHQSASIQAYLSQLISDNCNLSISAVSKHIIAFPGKNLSVGELEEKTLSLKQSGIRAKADREKGTIIILEEKNVLEVKLKAALNANVQLLPRRF